MENSKYYITQIKYLTFAAAISLGIYLAVEEIIEGGSIKTFLVFFFASVVIYLIEFSIIQQDALLNNQPRLDLSHKRYRIRVLFYFLFLPIANMILLSLVGITHTKVLTFISAAFILTFSIFVLLNHVKQVSLNQVKEDFGIGPDIQKLVFIFFASIVSYSIVNSPDTSIFNELLIYILYSILIFFTCLSIFLYRGYTKNEILINGSIISYIGMLALILINVLSVYKIEVAVGAYLTLVFYTLTVLTDVYNETKKLDPSVLGKYLSMILLATAILLLA